MKRSPRLWPVATCAVVLAGVVLAPSAAEASTTATSASGSALAVTPPMGFNNWARFGCSTNNPNTGDVGPSETLILNQAASLVSSGLAAKGYKTVTIDDCWMTHSRDANGNLVTDTARFPNGMAYIGQQLHNQGLKFGIYEDIGNWTCGGFPGDYNHFQQDADLFASWDVDYVKLDGCNMPSADNNLAYYTKDYAAFAAALKNNASHRDMVFSNSAPAYFSIGPVDLSNWYSIVDASSSASQLWRSGYDVKMAHAAWKCLEQDRQPGRRADPVRLQHRTGPLLRPRKLERPGLPDPRSADRCRDPQPDRAVLGDVGAADPEHRCLQPVRGSAERPEQLRRHRRRPGRPGRRLPCGWATDRPTQAAAPSSSPSRCPTAAWPPSC